jgi:hypothetical protein
MDFEADLQKSAINKLINEVLSALNSKEIVGDIFFVLTKAFHSVDHDVLI